MWSINSKLIESIKEKLSTSDERATHVAESLVMLNSCRKDSRTGYRIVTIVEILLAERASMKIAELNDLYNQSKLEGFFH